LIRSSDRARRLHHKANSIGAGHAPENKSFLEEVAQSVADARVLLIVGPSNEEDELVKHVRHSHSSIAAKIEGVETVNHPTDGELRVRKFERVEGLVHDLLTAKVQRSVRS
jgi:hypothetical protein